MAIRKGVKKDEPAPQGQGEAVTLPVIKWEDGLEVEGELLEVFDVTTQFGDGQLVALLVDGQRQVFGCPARLKTMLQPVKAGAACTIRCVGKTATKNGLAWDFRVFAKGLATQEQLPF